MADAPSAIPHTGQKRAPLCWLVPHCGQNTAAPLVARLACWGGGWRSREFPACLLDQRLPGPNSPADTASWWHRASVGRDSYVRVVNIGYLFPWGNRASRITISDREIQVNAKGEAVAYLVQKQYIAVKEPQVTYSGDHDEPYDGRGNPIRHLLVKTVTTPPIDFDNSVDPGINVGPLPPTPTTFCG